MSDWLNYESFPDKCDAFCWAELKCTGPAAIGKTYVSMCRWWEGYLYDAEDGADVAITDQIPECRVIGVMPIEKPETTFIPSDNVLFLARNSKT
jgi:hypothetical protein